MVRISLPESKLRARKRRQRIITGVLSVLGAAALVGGLVGLLYLPHWRVAKVEVAGVDGAQAEKVKQAVWEYLEGSSLFILPNDNMLLYPRDEVAAALLQKFPVFASAEVRATSLRSLGVEVVLRTPAALWCGQARSAPAPCLFVDERGVAYEPSANFGGAVYTTYYGVLTGKALPKQFLSEEEFRSLAALARSLEEAQNTHITTAEVEQNGDAHFYFENGFKLIFSLKDGGGDVYERFTLALTAEPFVGRTPADFEYLDLRFGDRLYYKLKGE